MTNPERQIPSPTPTEVSKPFWDAAGRRSLVLKHCKACGQSHHYPRKFCPFCFSDETDWIQSSGQGVIYSFTVMRRAPVPFAVAYVTLAEGPSMLTNIVDCDFDALAIGQKVKVTFKPSTDGMLMPMFTPA
jgi:uncharacterized protein